MLGLYATLAGISYRGLYTGCRYVKAIFSRSIDLPSTTESWRVRAEHAELFLDLLERRLFHFLPDRCPTFFLLHVLHRSPLFSLKSHETNDSFDTEPFLHILYKTIYIYLYETLVYDLLPCARVALTVARQWVRKIVHVLPFGFFAVRRDRSRDRGGHGIPVETVDAFLANG